MIAESIGGASGMPTLTPPQGMSAGSNITAWANDARVNALWSINQNRNAWIGVANLGWRKLANNSDSAVVALTMLAAHARETQSSYSYREEADGMIHEISFEHQTERRAQKQDIGVEPRTTAC